MNKYQEALDFLEEECRTIKKLESRKHVRLLKELVDKETPQQVLEVDSMLRCPECGMQVIMSIGKYCPKCGQALTNTKDFWRSENVD